MLFLTAFNTLDVIASQKLHSPQKILKKNFLRVKSYAQKFRNLRLKTPKAPLFLKQKTQNKINTT